MRRIKQLHLVLLLPLLTFCGSSPSLNIVLSGATAFNDNNVRDIVFIFQSQAGANGILDQDKNGVADFFVYPTQCGSTRPAGCGFLPNPGTITVGDLPLDYSYSVVVQLRNSSGTLIYDGQAMFQNTEENPGVAIAID
jgi:hypothetical protein